MCPRGMSAEATHLPVGDIALWFQSQLSCGHRERTVPAAKPHCGVVRDTFACVAAVVLAKPWPRLPRRQARRLLLDAPYKQGVFQGGEAAMGRLRRIPRRAVLKERTWP